MGDKLDIVQSEKPGMKDGFGARFSLARAGSGFEQSGFDFAVGDGLSLEEFEDLFTVAGGDVRRFERGKRASARFDCEFGLRNGRGDITFR